MRWATWLAVAMAARGVRRGHGIGRHVDVNYETPASAGPQDVLGFYNRYFAGEGWHAESVIFPGVAGSEARYANGVRRVTMRVVVQGYSLTADHDTTD